MDFLTHIFLPMTAAYVWKRGAFSQPYYLLLGLFGIVPDFDKFAGLPYLHSLVTLVPLAVLLVVMERAIRSSTAYGGIASFFMFSHLFLDVLDRGPVPFLYPFVQKGVGLSFPLKVTFHSLSFSFKDAPAQLVCTVPEMGGTYQLLSGFGMASVILFVVIYVGLTRYKW